MATAGGSRLAASGHGGGGGGGEGRGRTFLSAFDVSHLRGRAEGMKPSQEHLKADDP